MPPLTLIQKRALLAAKNNYQKLDEEYMKAVRTRWSINSYTGRHLIRAAEQKIDNVLRKWNRARILLKRLENKLEINGRPATYNEIKMGVISNLLTKHAPLMKEKIWLKGLEAEKKRALANFALLSSPSAFRASPVRKSSPRRKTPSPPRARGPSPRSPATLAREGALGIMGGARHRVASPNNTHITWSRTANGKINRFKTLDNINLRLTNTQRNALARMSESKAVNTIRQLARNKKGA